MVDFQIPQGLRLATTADVPRLTEMFAALAAEAPYYRGLRFAPDKAAQVAYAVADGTLPGVLLVADDEAGTPIAYAGAMIAPHPFFHELVATELSMYVSPLHRRGRIFVRLLDGMVRWARAAGAYRLVLGVSTGINTEQVARVYRNLGFVDTGVSFAKELR